VAGQTYFGRNNYIEYIAGNMPVILSAPHGGNLTPAELPDRTSGTFGTDLNTEDLTRKIRQGFIDRCGAFPHTIICHLDRIKIDCNREIVEGAGGNALTEISWNDFQNFITSSRQTVTSQFVHGLYLDMHGHGHPIQRLELGYLLDSSLDLTDAQLNSGNYGQLTSIRNLDIISPSTFAQLLRGTNSLGGLLAARGYPSVPSPTIPTPGSDDYFNGGYNTLTHGSKNSGTVSAIQIECNYTGVRDTSANRSAFATQLVDATGVYFTNHFGFDLNDYDGDRLSNFLEYALGGDPNTSTSTPLPQAGKAGGRLALTFNRVLANTDITMTVQANDSVTGTWTDLARSVNGAAFTQLVGGVTITESGSGAIRSIEVRDIFLLNDVAHPRRFMRLQVTR
jgi:N-formylglutamate amidohydrolase